MSSVVCNIACNLPFFSRSERTLRCGICQNVCYKSSLNISAEGNFILPFYNIISLETKLLGNCLHMFSGSSHIYTCFHL